MPTTLTLKNVPDPLYQRLKATAKAHRRSLNQEAILCLETALTPSVSDPGERLARLRAFRDSLGVTVLPAAEIDQLKRQGRP